MRLTKEREEEIRDHWEMMRTERGFLGFLGYSELLSEIDALRKERLDLFLELGKYSDVPSFEYWKDRCEDALAKLKIAEEALEQCAIQQSDLPCFESARKALAQIRSGGEKK